jgi:hypothetical protein
MKLIPAQLKSFKNKVRALSVQLFVFWFVSGGATGQPANSVKENIIKKFNDYVKNNPREEVFIHTDRDAYISGEDLWFNVYLTDRLTMLPVADSKIVYFEILNPENRPIVQKKVGIVNGYGAGHAVLSDSLSTGEYLIRGYTCWMKNFLPENCFYKSILIYNRDSSKTFTKVTKLNLAASAKDIIQTIGAKTDLNLAIDNTKQDVLDIFIKADDDLLAKTGDQYFLFIQTHGVLNFAENERITPAGITVQIPKKQLLAGINQVTLFTPDGVPVKETYIYTPGIIDDRLLTIKSEDTIGRRSSISVELNLSELENTVKIIPRFSISVTPLTGEVRQLQIGEYMIFGSEFGLSVQNSFKSFNTNFPDQKPARELLDNIRSNWIDWGKILSDSITGYKYPIEKENSVISGTLLDGEKKPCPPGEFICLSVPGKAAVFQYAVTDNNGYFKLPVHIDEVQRDVILQPGNRSADLTISIESPFSQKYPGRTPSGDSSINKIPEYLSDWSAANQVRKIYKIQSSGDISESGFTPFKPVRFYGKPDEEIVLDDYIKLPDMEEVFFEIVNYVSLKKKKSGFEFSMIDPIALGEFENPPASMIDGVIINDPDKIAALDPELVEKIDVVLNKYFAGDFLFYGIVNVITVKGDGSIITLPENAVRIPHRAIDPVPGFISPDYRSKDEGEKRIPDLRNTLYWNPKVAYDKEGKAEIMFWTGDAKSDYVINIQGINTEGRYVSSTKIIHVR